MRATIIEGWRCNQTKLWRVSFVKCIKKNNTKTVLCDCPPTEFLPKEPPPIKAIANVYELKTQPELVSYYRATAGFPTKPTWVMAIKNREFASWLGLTAKAVTKHFPELERRQKDMAAKHKATSTLQRLQQVDTHTYSDNKDNNTAPKPQPPPCPTTKQHEVYIKLYDLEDEAQLKMYTNQTG